MRRHRRAQRPHQRPGKRPSPAPHTWRWVTPYAGKARLALEAGKQREHERWLAQAFEADPRSAEGHYVRALALRKAKDEAGARRELEAALASPDHRAAAKALGKSR